MLVVAWGCSPVPPVDDPDVTGTAVITGRLEVLEDRNRTTINETEPNDDFDPTAPVATAAVGTQVEIFGSLQDGDPADAYVIATSSAMVVDVVLSFDFDPEATDFDFGLYDFANDTCRLNGLDLPMSACVEDDRNPESGRFEIAADFGIAVRANRGSGNYAIGLTFSPGGAARARAHEFAVQFAAGEGADDARTLLSQHGLELLAWSPAGTALARCHLQDHPHRHAFGLLRHSRRVRHLEPNYAYAIAESPNDDFYGTQWHYELINLPAAWDTTVGTDDVVVAVVDTGVLLDHPELRGRLVGGYDFITDPASARDGDGPDPDPTDAGDRSGGPGQSSFHGTHVAGTIGAATNNANGVAGVTWNGRIMPVRALGAGGGTSFDIAEAIRFAAGLPNASGTLPDRPADIINLSIAGPAGGVPSVAMEAAIIEAVSAGVVVIAAAGNEGASAPSYPAGYDAVVAVAACDPQMALAPYSNFGSYVDLTAPGGDLALDLNGDGFGDGVLSLGGTEREGGVDPAFSLQQGTSMAAPHVSGVAALMLAVNPDLNVSDVRDVLMITARDVGAPGVDATFGAGVIDAALALNESAARAGATAPTDPRLSLSTSALDFGSGRDELTVQLTNTGGGTLAVADVTVTETVGRGWLSARLNGETADAPPSGLTVAVDRTDQPDGRYRGVVTVTPVGGLPQSISVAMSVGTAFQSDETLFVVVIDAATRVSVAQDETSQTDGFAFEIPGLPPGTYKLYAGTDRDNDGLICDLGELCGGEPSAIRAGELIVSAGDTVEGLHFAVGELVFQASTTPSIAPAPIRRLE